MRGYKHGGCGTKEYRAWKSMIARCTIPTATQYEDYGGRGIQVCDRWRSFPNFLADMGKAPSETHSVDRIDNSGNYEPGNCRWATREEQANKKRTTRWLTFQGETLSLANWAKRFGVTGGAITNRLKRGWSLEDTLGTPFSKL